MTYVTVDVMWNIFVGILLLAIGAFFVVTAVLAGTGRLPRSRWFAFVDSRALRVSGEAWRTGQRAAWTVQLAFAVCSIIGGVGLLGGSGRGVWWTTGWIIALAVLARVGRALADKAVWRAGLVRQAPPGDSAVPAP